MKDEKGRPMTYWGGLEPTDPYEKGFIDGMAKQRDSRVQQMVESWTACLDCGQRVTGDSIHTCSPQLKTLTDEEILELTKDSTIFEYREFDDDMVKFARAILRKASEK